jgi:hypothetical protein
LDRAELVVFSYVFGVIVVFAIDFPFVPALSASLPMVSVVRASDNEESDDSSSSDSSSSSSAGEPEDSTTEDDSEMNQNADVVTSFHFPADPAHRRFQAGSVITLLVGLKNNGNQV